MSSFETTAKPVNIRRLEKLALETYRECPKYVTIVSHAAQQDDSLFHCVPSLPFVGPIKREPSYYQREFLVPGQDFFLVEDKEYGLFSLIKVLDSEAGPAYWLFSSVRSRMGFILDEDDLPQNLITLEMIA